MMLVWPIEVYLAKARQSIADVPSCETSCQWTIKLTEREIAPYKQVHPDDER